MARQLRIEIEGGLYHVIARGNGRQAIFHSEEDHRKFLAILAAHIAYIGKGVRPAIRKIAADSSFSTLVSSVIEKYEENAKSRIAILQALQA